MAKSLSFWLKSKHACQVETRVVVLKVLRSCDFFVRNEGRSDWRLKPRTACGWPRATKLLDSTHFYNLDSPAKGPPPQFSKVMFLKNSKFSPSWWQFLAPQNGAICFPSGTTTGTYKSEKIQWSKMPWNYWIFRYRRTLNYPPNRTL